MRKFWIQLILAFTLILGGMQWSAIRAQPDLIGWESLVRSMEWSAWVEDLESLESGCVLTPMQPQMDPSRWRIRSPWGESLLQQLEALPLAEHHADRALQRMLADGMLCFRLMEASTDRHRNEVEAAFEGAGLPADWAMLPMALTGWNNAYYGPGRRAGPWAMDLTSALSHGLEIRRGWDERHVPEAMTSAAIAQAHQAALAFPQDPLRQVMSFVRGPQAARGLDVTSLDAALLEWLHLFRVILQVDRNFDWNDTHALWMLRAGELKRLRCPNGGAAYFSMADTVPSLYGALRMENPWFTTDSIGFIDARPDLLIPIKVGQRWSDRDHFCARRPAPSVTVSSTVHVVGPGDVLGAIARDYGVRIGEIKRYNNLDSDLIRVGQRLEIPGSLGRIAPAPPSVAPRMNDQTPWIWHTVQEGESYWTISLQYPQAGLEDIMRMNDVSAEALQPGMKLKIPPP